MKKNKSNSAGIFVSSNDPEALENVHMSLAEQEETNSASEGTPQSIYIRVSTDTFETEPKSRMRKWFDGLCALIVIADIIITNYFRKKIMFTIKMCVCKAKGLANTGGAVSPSSRKKKLSCELTVKDSNPRRYGK